MTLKAALPNMKATLNSKLTKPQPSEANVKKAQLPEGSSKRAESATVKDGETKIDAGKPEKGNKFPEYRVKSAHSMAELIAPKPADIFSSDKQINERFNMLAAELEMESGAGDSKWASCLLGIHVKISADPEIATVLNNTALALYFEACSRLANTAAGAAITKKVAAAHEMKRAQEAQAAMAEAASRSSLFDDLIM